MPSWVWGLLDWVAVALALGALIGVVLDVAFKAKKLQQQVQPLMETAAVLQDAINTPADYQKPSDSVGLSVDSANESSDLAKKS